MPELAIASPRHVKCTVTPFPQPNILGILQEGYFLPMGVATELVVTQGEAEILKRYANRKIRNTRTKKVESRARFSFTDMGTTDEPLSTKIENRRTVANVPPLEVPQEKHNELLHRNLEAQSRTIEKVSTAVEKLSDVLDRVSARK